MRTTIDTKLKVITTWLLCFQLIGCGTILYPERRNKEPGRLDVGVVLLDGFWLLIGIIPGIIAFAVDFSSGAIYIPEHRMTSGEQRMRVVRFDPEHTTYRELEALIRRETGDNDFSFADKRLTYARVKNQEEAGAYFAGLNR